MARFQPSALSHQALENCGAGCSDIQSYGSFWNAFRTKRQNIGHETGVVTSARLKYLNCKKKREDKGKLAWPESGGGATDCSRSYNKWKNHSDKLAQRSEAYRQKLELKDKLDEELEKSLKTTEKEAKLDAMEPDELKRFKKKRARRRAKRLAKQGWVQAASGGELTLDAEGNVVTEEEASMIASISSTTMIVTGVAGVAVLGGLVWLLFRRND